MKRINAAFLIALGILSLAHHGSAYADTGAIGFGWDSTLQKEAIYSVNLQNGQVSQAGVIPDLKWLAAASFGYDAVTQSVAVLGYITDEQQNIVGGRIFIVDTTKNTTMSFLLPSLGVNFLQTLINPSDGNVYVLAYDPSQTLFDLFLVTLVPATKGSASARANLNLVGSFSIPSYVAGTAHIDANGVLSLVENDEDMSGGAQQLFSYTISSGEIAETPLGVTLQADAPCPGSSQVFGIGYSSTDSKNIFYLIGPDGTTNEIGASNVMASFVLGSQVCAGSNIMLVGLNQSLQSSLFSVSQLDGEVNEIPLGVSNLTVVFPTQSVAATFADSISTLSTAETQDFNVVSAKTIRKCAKKYSFVKKATTFEDFVNASRRVKFSRSSCKKVRH